MRPGANCTVATRDDRRALRERLDDRDPPPAAGEDDAQQAVDRAGGVEQGGKLGLQARPWSASRRRPSHEWRRRSRWSCSANGRPP